MKILWITNGLLPEATAKLQGQSEIKGTGGWLLSLADALKRTGGLDLTIASITPLVKELTKVEGESIHYFAIPYIGDSVYKKKYEEAYRDINDQLHPDVVHIHGTEFPHSLAALRAYDTKHTVVSLQGMASVISRYYMAGLSKNEIRKYPTIHDLLRMNLHQQQREMERRGHYEEQLLREATNVIGRTQWDYSHSWAINPQLRYFHCDELLREEFYTGERWAYDKCDPHSIFISQGSYPLKGLHKVLEALPLVKSVYPDIRVRVAGLDITYRNSGIKSFWKISTYGRIIKSLIKKNILEENVVFLGSLNAESMKSEYLRSNVFVCPSSIENSPNSLCEAQILGVPVVASYAGGIPDMMKGDEGGLYRFDETEMMAEKICRVFEAMDNVDTFGMQEVAQKRHDEKTIVANILEIYKNILEKAK